MMEHPCPLYIQKLSLLTEALREALQQGEQANEQLRNWIDTITPFMHRMQLRWYLQAVWRMGNDLHERQPADLAAMEKWVSLASASIRRYLDDETANIFLVHDGDSSFV